MLRQQKSVAAICDAADGTGSEIVFPGYKFETQPQKATQAVSRAFSWQLKKISSVYRSAGRFFRFDSSPNP